MKRNLIARAVAVLSASAFIALSTGCAGSQIDYGSVTDTYKVEKQDLENYISVTGSVEGTNIVKVTSEVNARVQSLNVELGSEVKEGDVLCVFDSSDFQAEYDALKSSSDKTDEKLNSLHEINLRTLNSAKSEKETALAQAQRAIDNAIDTQTKAYNKYNDLASKRDDYYNKYVDYYNSAYNGDEFNEEAYAKSNEYYSMYKEAEAEYSALGEQLSSYDIAVQNARDAYSDAERSANMAIQSAQDAIDNEKFDIDNSIQTQLDKLQEKIDKCTVKAPKSGLITSLNIAEGSIPTSEAIMTIEDTSKLRISVQVNEADILNVKVGQKAIITTTATGDEEFSGSVSRVVNILSGQITNAYSGETSGGGYTAEITIDDQNRLLVGMSAQVKIILEEKSDVIAVPYDAILANDDGTFSVFAAEGSGTELTAKEVKVEKGMETNYLTEIITTDISDGDLIVSNPYGVYDGKKLTGAGSYYETVEE